MSSIDAIWTSALSTAEGDEYDAFVGGAKGGHYTQTRAWGNVLSADRFSVSYFLARRSGRIIGAGLVRRPLIAPGIALPFFKLERGPVFDDPRDADEVLGALAKLARRRAGWRLSVMPYWSGAAIQVIEQALGRHGFRNAQNSAGSHVRSLRLDLTALPQEGLFEASALSKVRREIRRADRAGAISRPAAREDMMKFRAMHERRLHSLRKRAPRQDWYKALDSYFLAPESSGAMFVCELNGNLISTVFAARHDNLVTYIMGEATEAEVAFPKTIQPLARAISWAKEAGACHFDFGGIPVADDKDVKRMRIADFKRSFSKTEVTFVHEHARWLPR